MRQIAMFPRGINLLKQWWAIIPLILSFLAYSWLAVTPPRELYQDSIIYFGCMAVAWSSAIYLFIRADSVSLRLVVFGAMLFRIVAFIGAPILEDDFFRFLWDGYVFGTRHTPYGIPPIAFFDDSSVPRVFQGILNQVNYPEYPTIYGPVLQAVFLLGYFLTPAKLYCLKFVLAISDLSIAWLLFKNAPRRGLILYLLSPLVIQEAYFTAHPDLIGVACLFGAAVLAIRRENWLGVGILSAMAIGTKVTALPAIAVILLQMPISTSLVALVGVSGLYSPFLLRDGQTEFEVLRTFMSQWEFNSSLFGVVEWGLDRAKAQVITSGIFLVAMVLILRNQLLGERKIVRGDWIFGCFFLCAAVVNPWYLLWMAPFISLYPSVWGVVVGPAVALSYLHGLTLPNLGLAPYQHPVWLRPIEYGIVFISVMISVFRARSLAK